MAVNGGGTYATISTGQYHACAVTTTHVAYCWGYNGTGELGDNNRINSQSPMAVAGGLTFDSVGTSVGVTCCGNFSAGLTVGGAVYEWGQTRLVPDTTLPVPLTGGLSFATLSIGEFHACGIGGQGTTYCWGDNTQYQLGNTGPSSSTPVPVSGGLTFTSISAGSVYTCGVATGGTAYCWGGGQNFGQWGTGATSASAMPLPVLGALRFAAVSASGSHTCGLSTRGGVYCWGLNGAGELGNGTRTSAYAPVRVTGLP